jgi:hypothetical protein
MGNFSDGTTNALVFPDWDGGSPPNGLPGPLRPRHEDLCIVCLRQVLVGLA